MTREGYGEAYARGYDRTVRFLCSRSIPGESAREFAQAAWVRGWERIGQLRNENMLLTWVNTIALNYFRASSRRAHSCAVTNELPGGAGVSFAALEVDRILRRCEPRDRDLFEQYLEGATAGEIARARNVSETAVRIRFLRARRAALSQLQRVSPAF
jgi:DNA-directed RNA polymerase specialized sigma24 family protein